MTDETSEKRMRAVHATIRLSTHRTYLLAVRVGLMSEQELHTFLMSIFAGLMQWADLAPVPRVRIALPL